MSSSVKYWCHWGLAYFFVCLPVVETKWVFWPVAVVTALAVGLIHAEF